MNKGILFASLVFVGVLSTMVFALNPTTWTDTKATTAQIGTLYDTSGPTARYTPGANNAFVGNITVSGGTITLLSDSAPRTNITPAAAGALIWNSSDNEVCVSSSTNKSSWVLVTSTSTACHH